MSNKDHITIKDGYVYRPAGVWTKNVHKFLDYLRAQGFSAAPLSISCPVFLPAGFNDNREEIVTYIPGKVGEFPNDIDLKSENILISAAKLLRKFHDISVNFLAQDIDHKLWQFQAKEPVEVICHGDFAPYNVVYQDQEIVGIIDFDCAHPGSRAWDLSYALYRWVPLTNPYNKDGFGNLKEQLNRARLFLDAYDIDVKSRIGLTQIIIERIETLVNFMFYKAKSGNQIQKLNIKNNHHLGYLADIEYIKANKSMIEQNLRY